PWSASAAGGGARALGAVVPPAGINCFQTPVNAGILTSSHESQMFLMASRMVNPFQKVFNLLCPDPSEESLSMAAIALRNNGCCVSRHENNINLIVHLHQSSWVTRCIVNEHSRSQQWA
uniref:Uncharacterized protein n=1 Tax=Apteryx owenii TaxID=8824 RepID=A0A8B9P2M3_APTOW